ncbi:MAG: hypothetical protein P1V20_22700 [Verrucomicrobiales bacterium]|nr:hypothetical protein [Verrucomicrobiales bacterium]
MSSKAAPNLSSTEVDALAKKGRQAHEKGHFREAIESQLQVVNHYAATGRPNADASKLLCLYFYGLKDYNSAATILKQLTELFPEDPDNFENLGVVMRKLHRIPEAVQNLERAVKMAPDKANIHDALTHSYGQLGNREKCRQHGRLSLQIKDRESLAPGIRHPVPETPPPPFSHKENNIISFSLWGKNPRYLTGAIRNARLIPDIYPGWKCRVYHDNSVPDETLEELRSLQSELISMASSKNFFDGLFWRFLPATDKETDRFLIRDIDSVVNVKERVAVDEWLDSDKYFHVMRDYFSHSELILAGMWGGVGGVLPSLNQLLSEFKPNVKATETYDQLFLRLAVWPTISQSILIHDSAFDTPGSIPFPKYGNLPPGKHIGQNEAAVRD